MTDGFGGHRLWIRYTDTKQRAKPPGAIYGISYLVLTRVFCVPCVGRPVFFQTIKGQFLLERVFFSTWRVSIICFLWESDPNFYVGWIPLH